MAVKIFFENPKDLLQNLPKNSGESTYPVQENKIYQTTPCFSRRRKWRGLGALASLNPYFETLKYRLFELNLKNHTRIYISPTYMHLNCQSKKMNEIPSGLQYC